MFKAQAMFKQDIGLLVKNGLGVFVAAQNNVPKFLQ